MTKLAEILATATQKEEKKSTTKAGVDVVKMEFTLPCWPNGAWRSPDNERLESITLVLSAKHSSKSTIDTGVGTSEDGARGSFRHYTIKHEETYGEGFFSSAIYYSARGKRLSMDSEKELESFTFVKD